MMGNALSLYNVGNSPGTCKYTDGVLHLSLDLSYLRSTLLKDHFWFETLPEFVYEYICLYSLLLSVLVLHSF